MIEKEFAVFNTPMSESLHPELDDTPLLNPVRHSQYRSLVGIANWLVTLGRFNIAYATNTFSRFSMQPRLWKYIESHILRLLQYLNSYVASGVCIECG